MADLVLELYSEEIPAGMQVQAAEDLRRLVSDHLADYEMSLDGAEIFAAPQRLALLARGLEVHTKDRNIEKKGPKLAAPEQAIQGFLKANGLDSTDGLTVCEHPKGDYYVLKSEVAGRAVAEVLAEIVPAVIENFPWPKSMRWGDGKLRWVRPLRAVLCRFDGNIVPFEVDGLASGGVTYGHRFLQPEAIEIHTADDYAGRLEAAKVVVDSNLRQQRIAAQVRALAEADGLVMNEDDALLRETAGLVEWPVALMGRIDEAFMEVPEEVLISVMRTHQKYFSLRDPKSGKLAPRFITISNMETVDGGAAIINGNERVLRARLSDGKFFWDQDRKTVLADRLPLLDKIIFHAKLGTVREKTRRIESLAEVLSDPLGAQTATATEAARLCKADLVSAMVYEFPELQGIMGGYYADDPDVGAAIRDHYSPLGPSDNIPDTPEGCAVALADKIDTLVGFWVINEKPTGSKDPYALRRAALGVIRILLETETRLPLKHVFAKGVDLHKGGDGAALADQLLGFVLDRLKVYLRDQGVGHDVVNAVFTEGADDVFDLVQRAKKLGAFLQAEDGANLLAAFRRADGILGKADFVGADVNPRLLQVEQEKHLHQAIKTLGEPDLGTFDGFESYLDGLATLRAPVDAFFEAVMVNDDDAEIRTNRLNLLNALTQKMRLVATFEMIE